MNPEIISVFKRILKQHDGLQIINEVYQFEEEEIIKKENEKFKSKLINIIKDL